MMSQPLYTLFHSFQMKNIGQLISPFFTDEETVKKSQRNWITCPKASWPLELELRSSELQSSVLLLHLQYFKLKKSPESVVRFKGCHSRVMEIDENRFVCEWPIATVLFLHQSAWSILCYSFLEKIIGNRSNLKITSSVTSSHRHACP